MLSVKTEQGYLPLEHRQNFHVVYDYEGEQTLSFDLAPTGEVYTYLHENGKLVYQNNRFIIQKINKRKQIASIEAVLDLNEWKAKIHQSFEIKEATFSEIMLRVKPAGWTIENMGVAKNRQSIKLDGCSDYEILMQCKNLFHIVYEFHTKDRKLKVIDPASVQQRGLYMSDELNLDSVEYKGDASNFANRLYAYGKKTETKQEEDTSVTYVNFASINGGKEYVEQLEHVDDEIVSAYWQNNEYEDAQELFIAAKEMIKTLAAPKQAWSCNLIDLSRMNGQYQMLDFHLYDKPVLLMDGKAILHQIVEYTEYPDNQNLNKVVLSTTFKKIQGELSTIKASVNQIDEYQKYAETVMNEITRDVKSNSVLIENTYCKEEVDHRLSSILQQTDENITASVGAIQERVQTIESTKRYRIEISLSAGTYFKNTFTQTTVSASIFSWDEDITTAISPSTISWLRYSNSGQPDKDWMKTGRTITLTSADMKELAIFECIWNGLKQRVTMTVVYDGETGTQGKDGKDGKTSFFHIKYASVQTPADNQIKETPDKYIGTYVDDLPEDSLLASKYTWTQFQGDDGIAGKNGADGKTSYLHLRYSNDAGKSFTANNGKTPGDYLGQYTDFIQADSNAPSSYVWLKVKGEIGLSGPKGTDGKQLFTWLKYADSPTTGMSDLPANKTYIGLAYNKDSSIESNNYADYTWSLIKGDKGEQGVSGPKGIDGKQLYTWIKYANDAKGTGLSDDSTGKLYIGLAYNKTTNTESSNASDYTWSLIKGDKGDTGSNGIGISKVEAFYYLSTSNTVQVGGTWSLSAPAWIDGSYMWQKTVTSLSNGTKTESTPICVTGGKGQTGGTGATGKGITSVTAEYYVSTSKTTQTGGTWITTSPIWSTGKYVWTRSKVVYTDGTTMYTTPFCDSAWEAVNELKIGGRNLLKKSGTQVSNTAYNISTYSLGVAKPVEGDTCTVTMKGAIGAGKTSLTLYNSGGNVSMVSLTPSDFKDGFATKTFTWKTVSGAITANNTSVFVYAMPSTVTIASTIDWIRIDFGNKAPLIWTPAPEDIDEQINEEIEHAETRITETYESLIDITKSEIDLSVQSITSSVDNSLEQIRGLQNQLVLTNEQTAFIKTTTESLKNIVEGKVDAKTIQEWARFDGATLTLGASNSPFSAKLSNTELAFWQGNTKVAWISNNEMQIANSVIINILKVGNWQCFDEGSAGLTWRRL